MKITINAPNPLLWVEGPHASLERGVTDKFAHDMQNFVEANGNHIPRMIEKLHRPSATTFIENDQDRLIFMMMLQSHLVMEHVTDHEDCPWPKLHELLEPVYVFLLDIVVEEDHEEGDEVEKLEHYLELTSQSMHQSEVIKPLEDDREVEIRHDDEYLHEFVHTDEGDPWADILPLMVLIAAIETHLLAARREDGEANLFAVFGKLAHQYVYDCDSFYMWLTAVGIGMHVHRTAQRVFARKRALEMLSFLGGPEQERDEPDESNFTDFINKVSAEMHEEAERREQQ